MSSTVQRGDDKLTSQTGNCSHANYCEFIRSVALIVLEILRRRAARDQSEGVRLLLFAFWIVLCRFVSAGIPFPEQNPLEAIAQDEYPEAVAQNEDLETIEQDEDPEVVARNEDPEVIEWDEDDELEFDEDVYFMEEYEDFEQVARIRKKGDG
ncbi:hypothetical protein MMC28_004586 [Mycoblastus sanguinarius]|nr:hypothetical protein [Mycoblastus sanguinarius]